MTTEELLKIVPPTILFVYLIISQWSLIIVSMNIYQIMAYFAGGLIVLSTLPQVFKSIRTKEVRDLSLPMFILLGSAQTMWLIYGVHLNDLPLILTNAGSVAVVSINILLILKYRE